MHPNRYTPCNLETQEIWKLKANMVPPKTCNSLIIQLRDTELNEMPNNLKFSFKNDQWPQNRFKQPNEVRKLRPG
jgi:hypothetical protein